MRVYKLVEEKYGCPQHKVMSSFIQMLLSALKLRKQDWYAQFMSAREILKLLTTRNRRGNANCIMVSIQ
jgi:hypothetical protein